MNFKEIIRANSQTIKNIIKKITKEENEDLEQEVYLRVIKNSEKYKEGNLKAWINKIARNVSFDYLKSAKFRYEKPNETETDFQEVKDKKSNPENKIIDLERQKRILEEINKLKPKLKEVIIYTEFYGLSYEECAKKLNCPVGTIKSRVYNAKQELAQKLNDLL